MDDELEKLGPEEDSAPEDIQDDEPVTDDAAVDDDGGDADDAEDAPADENGDVESWESEEAYLQHHGLEGFKTVDEAVAALKKMQSQPKAEPERVLPKPTEAPSKESFFPRRIATAHVKALIDGGQFADEKTAQWYRSLATIQDAALDPMIDQMESAMTRMANGLTGLIRAQRDESWSKSPKWIKDRFTRDELDPIMNEYGLFDYRKAAHAKAMGGGEDFLADVLEKAAPAPKKTLPKFSHARRSAPSSVPSDPEAGKWSKYMNKDGTPNEAAADKLAPEVAEKFWGWVLKRAQRG